ncbi:hypothetical protein QLS71_006600 [Mariniflexile litorale]|uniref:Class IIb bacteriocin, lactobin A/cerein 7B family n=1 Tax=Mariniflexile litorale TaxID=3045158 RepID=A0AAU7EJZ0_9FLAO|nr:hypothetical protein [Mariniflexile sp. KMM 9835]MDQ8211382.1 hypothetical protein [Mariniflexile sp. KMM 9835]
MILETYRVTELNKEDLLTIEGGFFDEIVRRAGYITGVIVGSAVAAVHMVAKAIF